MKGKWKPWVNKNLLLYCFINNPFTFGKIPQHILSTKPFSGEERMCTMLLKLIKQNKLILTLLSVFFGPRHQLTMCKPKWTQQGAPSSTDFVALEWGRG